MPANHNIPHTAEARAKMRESHLGTAAPWKHRPSHEIGGVTVYRCGRCACFFSKEHFHKSNRSTLGIKTDCKACHSAISIASRNAETTRANGQRAEAARRARKAGSGGRVTAADWRELLELLGSACLKCKTETKPTQDHIIPLSKGGMHHPTNLQPLCRPCNERKQASTADYRSPAQRRAVETQWCVEFKRVP
jgi:5-methylcytosine-specific restriction endonuclease McrA